LDGVEEMVDYVEQRFKEPQLEEDSNVNDKMARNFFSK